MPRCLNPLSLHCVPVITTITVTRPVLLLQSNMFGTMDESMLARVEASLAAVADIKSHQMQAHHQPQFKHDIYSHDMSYMNNAAATKPHFAFNSEFSILL